MTTNTQRTAQYDIKRTQADSEIAALRTKANLIIASALAQSLLKRLDRSARSIWLSKDAVRDLTRIALEAPEENSR